MPSATGAAVPPRDTALAGAPELAVRRRERPGAPGAPIVLVHGLGGTLEEWEPLAALLAARHPVYSLDLRGHGRSGDADPTLAGCAADVARVVDHFGLRRPVVVGHELGGVVALVCAARRADVAAVVNLGGFGRPDPAVVAEHLGMAPDQAAVHAAAVHRFTVEQTAELFAPMPAATFERALDACRGDPLGLPGAVLAATARRAAATADQLVFPRPGTRAVRALFAELAERDPLDLAERVAAPVLTLAAADPPPPMPGAPARFADIVAAHTAHALARSRPGSRVGAVAGTRVPHLGRPEAVAELIEEFLAGAEPPRRR
ncbi:alpha/beta fold hydrolase [Streptomonospora nanhaiensis]|uniref:alpha/beta fold hydrolase n=1 Tax=Streptomonospora nanhaiensis TaxID=1323731 RepID=UPI001C38A35A|nr:alpha/beta hydrolase [Streptomonospora nanhaiensis]MBV2362067.1 alpha/beta fold hydrolase [Streptomonospora nanhaiensis]